jgi:hypothetical protein
MAARMQALNLSLSRYLDDGVTTYADNGINTSADRDDYLNQGSRILYNVFFEFWRLITRRTRGETKSEIGRGIDFLNDFIYHNKFTAAAQTFDEDGVSAQALVLPSTLRSKELLYVFGMVNALTPRHRPYRVISKSEFQLLYSDMPGYRVSPYNRMAWLTKNNDNPNLIRLSGAPNADVCAVTILTYPNYTLTSGGSEDIQWSSQYDLDILRCAQAYAYLDNNEPDKFEMTLRGVFTGYQIAPQILTQVVAQEEAEKTQ